jgi:hypothetical protein
MEVQQMQQPLEEQLTGLFEDSELRLFLSVDIVGSTSLKHIRNHSVLMRVYDERVDIISDLYNTKSNCPHRDENEDCFTKTPIQSQVKATFKRGAIDWQQVIQNALADFDKAFTRQYLKMPADTPEMTPGEMKKIPIWKAKGDELLYSIPIPNRRYLHNLFVSFMKAVLETDKKLSQEGFIRLKSSAWIAGFPIRNRVIQLPITENASPANDDYLGPDIDTGFRLGAYTLAGFTVISIGLALLLSDIPQEINAVRALLIGWEVLKGVWRGGAYPIIWVFLPAPQNESETFENNTCYEYERYKSCEEFVNPLLAKYAIAKRERYDNIPDLRALQDELIKILNEAPKECGEVFPYVPQDMGNREFPEEHIHIKQILEGLFSRDERQSIGKSPPPPPAGGNTHQDVKVRVQQALANLTQSVTS